MKNGSIGLQKMLELQRLPKGLRTPGDIKIEVCSLVLMNLKRNTVSMIQMQHKLKKERALDILKERILKVLKTSPNEESDIETILREYLLEVGISESSFYENGVNYSMVERYEGKIILSFILYRLGVEHEGLRNINGYRDSIIGYITKKYKPILKLLKDLGILVS